MSEPQPLLIDVASIKMLPPRGLPRLAARAAGLAERNAVEYRELPCRSIVSRVETPRMPFRWAINPYRGCEFGCVYCYARYTHEFMELNDWRDFERKIFAKQQAAYALAQDLKRLRLQGEWIAIGTATDPYQPAERRMEITRSLLDVFAGGRGYYISITTKSELVTRDIDLLSEIARRGRVHVNMTITSPDYRLSRILEPRATRPDLRFAAVEALNKAGVEAGVFMMPLLPAINDSDEMIDRMCRCASSAGASYLCASPLFLRSSARRRFMPWLREEFPELVPLYLRLFGGRGGGLTAWSRDRMACVEEARRRHGLLRDRRSRAAAPPPLQPHLLEIPAQAG